MFLVMMELGSSFGYRRALESFRWREAEFAVEYDSSLTGLRGIIFMLENNEEVVWKVISFNFPYLLEQD